MDNQQESAEKPTYTTEQLSKKGFIKRNQLCLCGSGKKIKHCCKYLLDIRPKFIQDKFNFEVAFQSHNKNQIKSGFKALSREKFQDYLDSKTSDTANKKG